ncbi:Alkanal monooxygenase alpha chain [bacterium HR25]|nr:Alkanal monooxygenase alpha chain [bacterium HR25]
MHVGMAVIFQNPYNRRSDTEVYQDDLKLADLAEPLGFQSIWSVEHHFTDYTMVPDVLLFLAYAAGRTQRVQLGSMVVVLPWHDPLRVAEQVAMLDQLSGGRVILGIGRGAGRVEFEGFRVPMGESRDRFLEYAEMILQGLEQGYCEYQGQFVQQPRKDIRPRPVRSFRGRTYGAAVSPESAEIMARLGLGILMIPQKPWDAVAQELEVYRKAYREYHGVEAPAPIAGGWVYCHEDPVKAQEGAHRWIGAYWDSVIRHYEFGSEHFAQTRGYEYYGKMSEKVQRYGADRATEFFLSLQVWGTPEQCLEKILDIRSKTGAESFVGVFSYGGMPHEEAGRSMRLFAERVMPQLQRLGEATPARS